MRKRGKNASIKIRQSPAASIEQLAPQAGWWGGDILGYFAYLKGWTKFLLKNSERYNTTVFQTNMGCPALAMLDAGSSSAAIFQGTNGANTAHGISLRFSRGKSSRPAGQSLDERCDGCLLSCLSLLLMLSLLSAHKHTPNLTEAVLSLRLIALFGGQDVLFTQKGPVAVRGRAFLQEILPSVDDERLAEAVAAMGTELKRWADMSNQEVLKLELEDEISECCCIVLSYGPKVHFRMLMVLFWVYAATLSFLNNRARDKRFHNTPVPWHDNRL